MARSMARWTLAGFMALAATGLVGGLGTGSSTAEAAPRSGSPLAGSYAGMVPNVASPRPWEITISRSGVVKGSYRIHFHYRDRRERIDEWYVYEGAFAGTVDADGGLEISGEQSFTFNHSHSSTATFTALALVVADENGNLVVTDPGTGTAEVWTRQ